MKKFLIIGNVNAIGYKDTFPHIANREIFIRTARGTNHFGWNFIDKDGEKKHINSVWYTNLDSRHLYKTLNLTKTFNPTEYPRYDNYDAINVDSIANIPMDYQGVMGVPTSIVIFSPEQFEIVDKIENGYVKGKKKYRRIMVKMV